MNTTTKNNFIRIEQLSKGFQEGVQIRQVLNGCSLTMAEGEFVAIIGKSGTGKSTLLNLISGIDQADEGSISVGDQSLTALTETERMKMYPVCFLILFCQSPEGYPAFSLWHRVPAEG